MATQGSERSRFGAAEQYLTVTRETSNKGTLEFLRVGRRKTWSIVLQLHQDNHSVVGVRVIDPHCLCYAADAGLSPDMSRPTSQHRLSVGASSLPARNSSSRPHSHSTSLGTVTGNPRVSRRKSSNFTPAAHAAAIEAAVENGVADGSIAVNNRRSSMSIAALGALSDGSYPPVPSSLPHGVSVPERSTDSAIVDGPPLSSYADKAKLKARRASDGTRLTKKEKAATGDLKCDQCGKAYKHGSCLTKHLYVLGEPNMS